ncbi:MAG TPA: protein kinase family protein [Actinospica sp.]|nr:protein kinase family protein [Actinospica sp.]
MAALAENPAEQSVDEDVAAPQGPETEPTAEAVPAPEAAADLESADEESDGESESPESAGEEEPEESGAEAAEPADDDDEEAESESEPEAEIPVWEPATPKEPRELAVVGRRLGSRYRLERMVRGFGGVFAPEPQLWVGVDELLNRRVGVDLIATEHPLVEQVARAARDAAAVPDARFVQVLDAVQDEDLLYIVTEWVPGAEQLQESLADGPLSPARATRMVRDLAEAMVRAHEAEVAHGAMNPATVMITKAGEVKLRGLLVEATLSGAEPEAAEPEERYAADVLALGQIWYAALTARWPGTETEYGLEAAPADGDEIYTPAQIRAAVPKQVDATVCRALGLGEQEPFTTVKELADAIRSLPKLRDEVPEATVPVPPRTRSAKPVPAAANGAGSRDRTPPVWSPEPEERTPVWRRRGVLAVGGCAIVALATLAAFQLGGNDKTNTTSGSVTNATPHPSSGGLVSIPAGTVGKPLSITGDTIWDSSPSSGSTASAANAYNGSTAGWKMSTEFDAKWASENAGGIGLVFALDRAHTVDQVKFQIAAAGASVEILTAPAGSAPAWNSGGFTAAGLTAQKTLSNVSAGQTVSASFPATSVQYVAIIFTQVPQQGALPDGTPAGYRDTLLDVQVLGE